MVIEIAGSGVDSFPAVLKTTEKKIFSSVFAKTAEFFPHSSPSFQKTGFFSAFHTLTIIPSHGTTLQSGLWIPTNYLLLPGFQQTHVTRTVNTLLVWTRVDLLRVLTVFTSWDHSVEVVEVSRRIYWYRRVSAMGLLSEGSPLAWEETKKYADHVRKHGIQQFIHQYRKLKDRTNDCLKWGDEVSMSSRYYISSCGTIFLSCCISRL